MPTVNVTFLGMKPNNKITEYTIGKLKERFKEFLKRAGEVKITFKGHEKRNYFTVVMMVYMPNVLIRAEERGPNLRGAVDLVLDKLWMRFKRYYEKLREWRGEKIWKIVEIDGQIEGEEEIYPKYLPKVKRDKSLCSKEKMEVGEAIERMTLMGAPCFLFRNKDSGKWSVVYQIGEDKYGLVETP